MAELITAVFTKDPERPGAKPVLFRPGDDVPERFWPRLSRNRALWKDGKPPIPASEQEEGDGKDGDDTTASASPSSTPDTDPGDPNDDPESEKKPAARKTAATKPATRRKAAAEGTGGH